MKLNIVLLHTYFLEICACKCVFAGSKTRGEQSVTFYHSHTNLTDTGLLNETEDFKSSDMFGWLANEQRKLSVSTLGLQTHVTISDFHVGARDICSLDKML